MLAQIIRIKHLRNEFVFARQGLDADYNTNTPCGKLIQPLGSDDRTAETIVAA